MIDDDEEPLVDRLLDEADLCASEGAFDIARLLTEAATAYRDLMARHKTLAMNAAQARIALKNAGICPNCHSSMQPGVALEQTYGGTPEWPGADVVTMSTGGPGKLIDCLKCPICGFSTTKGKS